ncbi:AI-2E family transporter [Nocardioides marmoraquaticus]
MVTRRGLPSRLRGRSGREAREEQRARRQEREALETLELRARIEQRWAESRDARRAAAPDIRSGDSNFRRAQVPYGVDLAAAWGWRLLVIGAAGLAVLYLLQLFMVVVLPLVIALLLAALVSPAARWLDRLGLPRPASALVVVVVLLAVLSLLVTFVSSSIVDGASDLNRQVGSGLGQIRDWLRDGPLQVTDSQISMALSEGQRQLQDLGEEAARRLGEVGTALGHVVAGIFIGLFATYFFLADGGRIWAWVVRLFPRAGREQADSSGRVAWASLTQFVRATVIVAAVDAAGIALGAAILGVPFVGAIAVLVFLGAFVPLVGATVSGAVAVLVALVAQGPVTAGLMLLVVVLVQQVEAHVLQPFLMGRFVSVHPLGVIVAIAMGVLVAGIVGALVAVPLAASVNAVVHHLSGSSRPEGQGGGQDPGQGAELGEEPT